MIKKRKFSLIAIGLFLLAGLLSSADIDYKKFSGYWIGYGSSMQKVADDPFRKVTRRSETQFWFVVNEDGSISGEGYTSYEAEMQAMGWKIPVPNAGSIEAEVSGGSEKVTRKYAIVGQITEDNQIDLKAANETENMTIPGADFKFSINATWKAPVGISGVQTTAGLKMIEIKVPAKAWSPFQGKKPEIRQHMGGPHVVDVSLSGAKYGLEWHAIQMVSPRIVDLEERVKILERKLAEILETRQE